MHSSTIGHYNIKKHKRNVRQGDTVKKGAPLVTFDKDFIEEKEYDPTVVFIVTDKKEKQSLDIYTEKDTDIQETIMKVK